MENKYVSRAGLKLESVVRAMKLDFEDKIVLDVGSSTGGFTDFVLQNGAKKVFAVDIGTNQLHPSLRIDSRVELHEKTNILDFKPSKKPDLVLMDVSFVSVRGILPYIAKITNTETKIVVMLKPQFEAHRGQLNPKGIVKNESHRRKILHDFESWTKKFFIITDKKDSEVSGLKGNREKFYILRKKKQ